jgi:hypothetical protein
MRLSWCIWRIKETQFNFRSVLGNKRKFTPPPLNVAPSGDGEPGQIVIAVIAPYNLSSAVNLSFRVHPIAAGNDKDGTKVAQKYPLFGDSGRRHDGVIGTAAFAEDGLSDSQGKDRRGSYHGLVRLSVETAETGVARARRRNSVTFG